MLSALEIILLFIALQLLGRHQQIAGKKPLKSLCTTLPFGAAGFYRRHSYERVLSHPLKFAIRIHLEVRFAYAEL